MGREIERGGHHFLVEDPPNVAEHDYWAVWAEPSWECDLIAEHVPGRTFVDLGAWIGGLTLWADACGAARIIAVEPDPIALELLDLNLGLNDVAADMFRGAVSDRDGSAHLAIYEGDSMSRLGWGGLEIEALTVESLFAKFAVADVGLIKCDVEGAESLLMPDLAMLCVRRKIPLLLAYHIPWLIGSAKRLRDGLRLFGEVRDEKGPTREGAQWGQFLCLP